ncbi:MAG: hypothetical protein E7173_03530 [Firmicutes bacterium]|nr:hypothetical protein [Bacillota bacterium]
MKRLFICCIMLAALFIYGCSPKLQDYTALTYEELLAKIENGETFPLVIGSKECGACANYKITMNSFIKEHQVEVFEIDLSTLEDEEYDKLKIDTSFNATPTTVFYKDGKLTSFYNRITSSVSKSVVEDYFRSNGYIE